MDTSDPKNQRCVVVDQSIDILVGCGGGGEVPELPRRNQPASSSLENHTNISAMRSRLAATSRDQRIYVITTRTVFMDGVTGIIHSYRTRHHQTPVQQRYRYLIHRVLVDAACSTDGAVRHLQHKYSNHSNSIISKYKWQRQ